MCDKGTRTEVKGPGTSGEVRPTAGSIPAYHTYYHLEVDKPAFHALFIKKQQESPTSISGRGSNSNRKPLLRPLLLGNKDTDK